LNSYGNYSVICGDGTNKEGVNVTTDRQMTTNEWHYLTLTYDAASLEMTFYADGEILHKATFGSALRLFPDNPGIITLGAAQFTGAVDEFQFWGRALSGDEIRVAMLDATEISDGLKGLYDFNAGSKGSYANAIAEYEFPAKYYTTVGTSNGGDGGVISVSPIATTPQSTEGRVLADIVAPTVYAVSFQMPEGTTVDAKVNNKAMIDPEQVIAGSTLTFTVATPADKEVDTVEINSVEATAAEGVYTATVDTDLDVIITLKETSSIFTIGIDGAEGEIEVFNLNGVRVDADNIVPGIYIVRQGGMTQKVLVK
ncbi:MAG: LamG domain-containing protein, partial [Muribaculaceae bacterium]|nr:LamG domain-containing protein [Muribaculaceae bacterium]